MDKLGIFELNKVYQGDCIELMKEIPDNSVDLIFADPPYNLQLNGELYRPNQTKVDAVDDEWDKFESFEEYDRFTYLWLKEAYRILKNSGSFWVIGTYHNIFRVGTILQNIGFWILNDIIWIKTNPMPNFKGTRFNNAHETLIWATKSKNSNYTFHYHSMKAMNDDLQMRSDWYLPICQGEERIKINGQKAHSTQKPSELLHRIIVSTSNPEDIVFDPFCGSGTTPAVAKRLGRRFLAFDKEELYIKITNERLAKIKPLDKRLLSYKIENKKPKVPFGNLIEKGYIKIGEYLYSKDKKFKALVFADGTIECDGIVGSIHKVSAKLLNKESFNGWSFWFVQRQDDFLNIDELRYDYERNFLKYKQNNDLFSAILPKNYLENSLNKMINKI